MKRSFVYLAFVTLAALAVVFFIAPADRPSSDVATDALLLPGLADQVNSVNRIEIVSAGNNTVATLQKGEQQWGVDQMGGYRADWSKIKALLAALAQARVVETKTDKPEYYSRLGVEDITAEDAGGVLVNFGSDAEMTGVLIGKQAQGRQGQYVRLHDAPRSGCFAGDFQNRSWRFRVA